MIDHDAPRDIVPGDAQMEADYARYCAMEEEVPEGLRYHPLIVHYDWARGPDESRSLDLSQFTEAELWQMTGTEVERE